MFLQDVAVHPAQKNTPVADDRRFINIQLYGLPGITIVTMMLSVSLSRILLPTLFRIHPQLLLDGWLQPDFHLSNHFPAGIWFMKFPDDSLNQFLHTCGESLDGDIKPLGQCSCDNGSLLLLRCGAFVLQFHQIPDI